MALTVEGVVENGQIKLNEEISLPEHTRVLVVVPDMKIIGRFHIRSPHLVNPSQAKDFEKKVINLDDEDAKL